MNRHGKKVILKTLDRFEKTGIKAREGKAGQKERREQQDREVVMEAVRGNPAQQEVVRALAKTVSPARCRTALAALEQGDPLTVKPGPRGARPYYLAENGLANEKS